MNARHDRLRSTSNSALSNPGADAELIAICAAFCDLERAYDLPGFAHETGTPEGDRIARERERITTEQDILLDRMCELPCKTLPGVQAMAAALAAWDRELLKDEPAKDAGEALTSHLVERLLALSTPSPDADLLAVCAEFCGSEAAFSEIYEQGGDDDNACDIQAAPILASWHGMLDRMAALRATTSDGLAARALALAQHSGIKPGTGAYPFAFEPGDGGGVTGRLLHMLLTDAMQLGEGPAPDPDHELLALRPEFDRLHALMIAYNQDLIPDGGSECADFDALCARIATAAPAVTTAGRAFQASAAMHHLNYRMSDGDYASNPAWLMLKGIAGDAYQTVEARL